MGRYSTLITPKAGSLFHAAFQFSCYEQIAGRELEAAPPALFEELIYCFARPDRRGGQTPESMVGDFQRP